MENDTLTLEYTSGNNNLINYSSEFFDRELCTEIRLLVILYSISTGCFRIEREIKNNFCVEKISNLHR